MLNKKLHISLIVLLIVLMISGSTLTVDNETYSIVRLIGLGAIEKYLILTTLLITFVLIFIISNKYKSINAIYLKAVFRGDYIQAEKLISEFYKQNKTLFFQQYLFLAFSTGKIEVLEKENEIYKANDYKIKRAITCKLYKYLSDILTVTESDIDIEKVLIFYENKKRGVDDNLIFLLKALNYFENGEFQNIISELNKISQLFCYPSIAVIIHKLTYTANKNLNIDNEKTIENLRQAADNKFLLECISKIV